MGKKKKDVVIDKNVLPIPQLGKELGRFEGTTFYIAEHEYGVLYHVYNSMDLIIRPNVTSGYETLCDLVRNQDVYNRLEGKEREDFELNLSAIAYILSSPTFVFSSGELTFEVATLLIQHLRKQYEEAMDAPLQEETAKENLEFEQVTLAYEDLKESLKDESVS